MKIVLLILALCLFAVPISAQTAAVTLAWNAPATPDSTITHYVVKRGTTPSYDIAAYNDACGGMVVATQTTCVDQAPMGSKWYYVALSLRGVIEGDPSNVVTVDLSLPLPAKPENLRATSVVLP